MPVRNVLASHASFFFVEFLDDVQIDACNKFSGLTYPVTPTLFLEFQGSENSVKEQAAVAGQALATEDLPSVQETSVLMLRCFLDFLS